MAQFRIGKLFKNLGLALLNATVVLVIIAAVSGVLLLNKIDSFGQTAAANATNAAFSAVGLNAQQTLTKFDEISTSLDEVKDAIKQASIEPFSKQSVQLEKLSGQLAELNALLGELSVKRAVFTNEAIEKLGTTLSESLIRVRDCVPVEQRPQTTTPS
ncbi:MAG: hypothetical protein ACR2OR_05365 [Hyphomicrobiales bacterium]